MITLITEQSVGQLDGAENPTNRSLPPYRLGSELKKSNLKVFFLKILMLRNWRLVSFRTKPQNLILWIDRKPLDRLEFYMTIFLSGKLKKCQFGNLVPKKGSRSEYHFWRSLWKNAKFRSFDRWSYVLRWIPWGRQRWMSRPDLKPFFKLESEKIIIFNSQAVGWDSSVAAALKSIFWGNVFLNQLHDFSLLSWNSFLGPKI